jgi:hypothetical protein
MPTGDPKDEYIDVGNNIRLFQTIRFAQLTIFIALTSGLLMVNFGTIKSLASNVVFGLRLAGVIVTFLYWALMERTMVYWRYLVRRAIELEAQLGFQQHTSAPRARIIHSTNVVRAFFAVVMIFWIVALIWFP